MPEDPWVPTLDESAIREEAINLAFPKGVSVVLIRKGTELYVLRNRCAHMSCTLSGGLLEGYALRCPCHEWRFDVRTGEFIDARELRIPTYDWKSEGGKIYIKLEG
ncbi:MAG TPA: Rieske (2Fe-2S) protein [Dehalococcoidia bacterium]|nr:Rieske (2Fe-2S) protein [Dehalococcoidia bacterium]